MNRCDTCRMPRERHIDSGHDFYSRDEERAKLEAAEKRAADAERDRDERNAEKLYHMDRRIAVEDERDALRAQLEHAHQNGAKWAVEQGVQRERADKAEKRAADAEHERDDAKNAFRSAWSRAADAEDWNRIHECAVCVERDALRVQLATAQENERQLSQNHARMHDAWHAEIDRRQKAEAGDAVLREALLASVTEFHRKCMKLPAGSPCLTRDHHEFSGSNATRCERLRAALATDAGAATAERLKRLERVYAATLANDKAISELHHARAATSGPETGIFSKMLGRQIATRKELDDALASVAELDAGKEPK